MPSIDVVVVAFRPNIAQLPWCLEGLAEHTDVPWSLLLVLDGFPQEDVKPIRQELDRLENPHLLKRNVLSFPQPVYFKRSLATGLNNLTGAPVAVVTSPHFRIQADGWVNKIQMPFNVDRHTAVVGFGGEGWSESLDPFRAPQPARMHLPRSRMTALSVPFVGQVRAQIEATEMDDANYQRELVSMADGCGANCWLVQSIRTSKLEEHVRHGVPSQNSAARAAGENPRKAAGSGSGRDR